MLEWFKSLLTPKKREYDAARPGGANRFYRPVQSSGAQERSVAWQSVTDKLRDLDRNNPHVAGMKRRFTASLVGEGSWPRPKVLKNNPRDRFDFDVRLNTDILDRWEVWAKHACANGDSVYQLQRICANSFFIDGGILIHKVVKNGRLCLEPVELDQLDSNKDYDSGTGNRIVDGIELDQFNEPVAYYISKRFPSECSSKTFRIPASDIINLFDRERATSVSGISRLASSVMNFKNIASFRADTMTLARVATGYGLFVETANPEDFYDMQAPTDEQDIDYVTPGAVHYLRPGEKIQAVNALHPGTTYGPFVKSELQSASVGSGMSYESVSNDGANTNFSGARQMMLFERAMLRYTFSIFEEQLYSRIYEWFIEFEVSFGGLRMPNFDRLRHRYLRVSWSRPKTEWVDPLKDAKAASEEIAMGANTITDFCETNGRDIEEIVATRKYEKQLFEKAGLVYPQTIESGDNQNEETADKSEYQPDGQSTGSVSAEDSAQ